ncbi:MAG: hypothetical protein WKF34_03070 [Pyrinomonadaceae bacterium]
MDDLRSSLNRAFDDIDARARNILSAVPSSELFVKPVDIIDRFTVGESVIRSAAIVEQTFNGITRRLWDDPFEWTLPEKLSDKAAIVDYIDEVAATRTEGFRYLASDADLLRSLPAPIEMKSLNDILTDCLLESSIMLGRASALLDILKPGR